MEKMYKKKILHHWFDHIIAFVCLKEKYYTILVLIPFFFSFNCLVYLMYQILLASNVCVCIDHHNDDDDIFF